mgnify:FL=1|jgi:hypothetical protein
MYETLCNTVSTIRDYAMVPVNLVEAHPKTAVIVWAVSLIAVAKVF